MRNPLSRQHDSGVGKSKQEKKLSAESLGIPTNGEAYFRSLNDLETVEYVRCKFRDCHVLKVPPAKSTPGWSATELTDELWQGTVKVVDRGTFSGVVFLDRATDEPFAVCPLEDEVERCTDSSRYFILKVKNAADGKVSRICLAFNERTQAFDFNVALATSRKELEHVSNSLQPAEDSIEPVRTGEIYVVFPSSPCILQP
jgi:adaptin ear-binding coat-associated protein 1/2